MKSGLKSCLLFLAVVTTLNADEKDPELRPFQGHWEVIELVEDGHVIPPEAIKEWLPSGGQFEIIDNAMTFTSTLDGKKHAKVFAIDATEYPKGFDLLTRERKEAIGIYRFDEGRLIVCLSDPEDGPQPSEFSAKKGSKRMMMVMKKISNHDAVEKPPASPPISAGTKVLNDADITRMLIGSWRYRDDVGALLISFSSNGTWSTIREVQEMRLFQKVFVRTPISSGTWVVKNGTLNCHCTASIHRERVNHNMPFIVRSISESDLIFVDSIGGLGKAVKVH